MVVLLLSYYYDSSIIIIIIINRFLRKRRSRCICNEAHIPVDNTIAIQETFMSDANHYTNQDKESSKRFFLRKWLERYD